MADSAEGRARHARIGRHRLDRGMCPVGHRPLASSSGANAMPRLASGPYSRTHRVRPSEKPPLTPSPGLAPGGHLSSDGRLRGGAGSARPQGGLALDRGMSQISQPASCPHHGVEMECLGIRGASQCGRTECVPPRKPPLALSPSFSRKAIRAALAPRGGAGSARPRGRHGLDRGMCPVGQPASCVIKG